MKILWLTRFVFCITAVNLLVIPLSRAEIEPNKDFVEKVWKEDPFILPAYPADKNLIELKVPNSNNKYYIDQASVNVGKKDQVARYTIVIQTPSGARNVFHEGIHCYTGEVKSYGYAPTKAGFKVTPQPEWRIIDQEEGVYVYRMYLKDIYLCESKVVRFKVKDIIQILKYPPATY